VTSCDINILFCKADIGQQIHGNSMIINSYIHLV